MFQCIACTKQAAEEDGDDEQVRETERESGTPKTKEAVKSLTAQIKDMALKFTGAYKQCKPSCTGSSSTYKKGLRSYPDYDTNSEGVQYPYMGGVSSGSNPSWDLRANFPSGRSDPTFIGGISGDQTPRVHESVAARGVVLEQEDESKEWVAHVEPGVHITFVSLPNGGNDLRRIRFNRDMFDKWQAQVWWGENYDRIMELYNVQRFNKQALNTAPVSEDEPRDSSSYSRQPFGGDSPVAAWLNNDSALRNQYFKPSGSTMDQGSSGQHMHAAGSSMDASLTSSRDEPSFSNASEIEGEWIEQDEPGVFVTIRQLPDGSKELRRVRFSRQRFGEEDAKKWWEDNRERIQAQYL